MCFSYFSFSIFILLNSPTSYYILLQKKPPNKNNTNNNKKKHRTQLLFTVCLSNEHHEHARTLCIERAHTVHVLVYNQLFHNPVQLLQWKRWLFPSLFQYFSTEIYLVWHLTVFVVNGPF